VRMCIREENDESMRYDIDVPWSVVVSRRSLAWLRSDSSSRSFSSRAFSRGSRTASSSYSASLPPAASCARRAASFSASFCLSVPFFLGAGAAAVAGLSFTPSSEDASQSLCDDRDDQGGNCALESGSTYDGPIVILVFSFPFAFASGCFAGYGTRRRAIVGTLCPDCALSATDCSSRKDNRHCLPQSDILYFLGFLYFLAQ
jgi:hypothetical protein